MSADTGAGVDDLFDKQAKTAEKLNKETTKNAKLLEQHYKKVEISSKIIADRQEKHLAMENKYMNQRRLMQTMQRSGAGGSGVMGNVMNMMQGIGGMKVNNYQRLQELNKKGLDMNSGDIKERNMLKGGGINSTLERLDKMFDNAFGGDSKWNKMFGGHGKMAAMGIGAGAIGTGLAVSKAIIDSSAMLQQMFKLMQFGFMLILKPIGDFFGFLMRPILILLLRKFIIPFYQKVYPWFATTGAKIGNDIATLMNYMISPEAAMVTGGVIVTGIAAILKGSKIFTNKVMDDFAKRIGVQVAAQGKAPVKGVDAADDIINTAADKTKTATPKKTAAWFNEDGTFNKNWQKEQAALKNAKTNPTNTVDNPKKTTTVEDDFKKGKDLDFTDQKQKGNIFNQLRDQFDKVQDRISTRKWNPVSVKNIANMGKALFKGFPVGMAADSMGVTDAILDEVFELVEGFGKLAGVHIDLPTMSRPPPDNMLANGGIINEPISGIGQRSGQSYLFGEAGSEMVVPMSKAGGMGGTTVNITIGNMSGDANDLNKLRSTILEVMQTVNVNRGR